MSISWHRFLRLISRRAQGPDEPTLQFARSRGSAPALTDHQQWVAWPWNPKPPMPQPLKPSSSKTCTPPPRTRKLLSLLCFHPRSPLLKPPKAPAERGPLRHALHLGALVGFLQLLRQPLRRPLLSEPSNTFFVVGFRV